MIARIWHGWTTPANADVYETLLKTEIFPGIAAKNIAGYVIYLCTGKDVRHLDLPTLARELRG